MLVAYTELARDKYLIEHNDFEYEDLTLNTLSRDTIDGKTVAKFSINNVEADGVSGYSIVIPEDLHEKIKVTSSTDILEITGAYAFIPEDLKDGFTIEVDPSVSDEDIKRVNITRHFRDKSLSVAYSSKKNYRYDEATGRWFIREMVAADKEGFKRVSDQDKHGLGYGQELIKFTKAKNQITKTIALDLTQPVYDIKTIVGADTFTSSGKKIFKQSEENSELVGVYTPDQLNDGVQVKDTVAYKGLDKTKQYKLVAVLNEITEDANGTAITPIAVKVGSEFTPDANVSSEDFVESAKTEIDFGQITNLKIGKKYVVYEYLFDSGAKLVTKDGPGDIDSADKAKALKAHEDPSDKAQTFVVAPKPEIKTTVDKAILEKIVTDEDLEAGITIRDIINYRSLDKSSQYKLIGVLNKVSDDGVVTPIAAIKTMVFKPHKDTEADNFAEKAIMFCDFRSVKNLEIDTKYVVYEYLFKDTEQLTTADNATNITPEDKEKALAVHENKDDMAQTVLFKKDSPTPSPEKPSLKTVVKVGEVVGSAEKAASCEINGESVELPVVDTVQYENLEAGKTYKLVGVLKNVTDNKVVAVKVGGSFTPEASKETTIDFGNVSLTANKSYIVYEYLFAGESELATKDQSGENASGLVESDKKKVIASHADDSDKAQSIVVTKLVPPTPPTPPTPEQPKPKKRYKILPKTGNSSDLLLNVLIGFSGAVFAGTLVARRKRR